MSDDIDELKEVLTPKRPTTLFNKQNLLSSGSTLLNIACTDKTYGSIMKGNMLHIVGDSDSGKSVLALSFMAEAARNPAFDSYRLIHNAPEDCTVDIRKFFGQKIYDRLEPPFGTKEEPGSSDTAEEFYDHLDDLFKAQRPFIEILDSENALDAEAEQEKLAAQKAARKANKDEAGSFGVDKPKVHSKRLKAVRRKLKQTNSILIMVSQTRDKIGFGAQFDPKTVSGGRALKFYSKVQIWLATTGNITRSVRGNKAQLGIECEVRIKKNHLTGKKGEVNFPIYWSYGIDDLGSMVDYLLQWGSWREDKGILRAPDFEFVGKRNAFLAMVDRDGRESELKTIVNETWKEVQEACELKRKPRYE